MPTYDVTISRTIEVQATITVQARTADAAEVKAVRRAREGLFIKDKNQWEEVDDVITIKSVNKA